MRVLQYNENDSQDWLHILVGLFIVKAKCIKCMRGNSSRSQFSKHSTILQWQDLDSQSGHCHPGKLRMDCVQVLQGSWL